MAGEPNSYSSCLTGTRIDRRGSQLFTVCSQFTCHYSNVMIYHRNMLKRLFSVFAAVLLVFASASCDGVKGGGSKSALMTGTGMTAAEKTSPGGQAADGGMREPADIAVPPATQLGVIAESSNIISDSDKAKVIKDLDKELGRLFETINGPDEGTGADTDWER